MEEPSGARTWHIYLGSQLVATVNEEPSGSPQTHFIIGNHLGYPEMVIDDIENPLWVNPLWTSDHLPFGETVNESGSAFDPLLRYPGQWVVPESEGLGLTELFYNGYRWYRPDWGRYSQADPIGLQGGFNLFDYAGQNPLFFVDPAGLAYFAKRKLDGGMMPPLVCDWAPRFPLLLPFSVFGMPGIEIPLDLINHEPLHEQLFFQDGKRPKNLGFYSDSSIGSENSGQFSWGCEDYGYDDCIMRKAVAKVSILGHFGPGSYCLSGEHHNNCQDWADAVRAAYRALK